MNLYTNRFKKRIIGLVFLLFKSQDKKSRLPAIEQHELHWDGAVAQIGTNVPDLEFLAWIAC